MRKGKQRSLTALTIAIVLVGAPALPAEPTCSGGPVVHRDAEGDGVPLFGSLSASADLTDFSVGFDFDGLNVRWQLSDPLLTVPEDVERVRLLVLGWTLYNQSFDATPYVFLEFSVEEDGSPIAARAGLGEHFDGNQALGASAENQVARWIDLAAMPVSQPPGSDTYSIHIPGRLLYNKLSWSGVTSFHAGSEFGSEHGDPTAPVAAVAYRSLSAVEVDDPGGPALWGLADWAPNDRVSGTPVTGYNVAFAPDEAAGILPELCRPTPNLVYGANQGCDIRLADLSGAEWISIRVDVAGISSSDAVTGSLVTVGRQDSAIAFGWISETGDIDARFNAMLRGGENEVRVRAGGVSKDAVPSQAPITRVDGFGIHDGFSRSGTWWFVVLLSHGIDSGSLSLSVKGPGISCGSTRRGENVNLVAMDDFQGSTAASAGTVVNAKAVVFGRYDVLVRNGLIAFAGALAPDAALISIASRHPDGITQTGYAAQGALWQWGHQRIFEIGPAGRYSFAVQRDIRLGTWKAHPALLWADMKLE